MTWASKLDIRIRLNSHEKRSYHAVSGSALEQNRGFLKTFLLILQCMWFVGFCQIAISPFSFSFFQQRLRATVSIADCSDCKSSVLLSQPFQWLFQLMGGPERTQYPPGRRILSTSIRKSPSNSKKYSSLSMIVIQKLMPLICFGLCVSKNLNWWNLIISNFQDWT